LLHSQAQIEGSCHEDDRFQDSASDGALLPLRDKDQHSSFHRQHVEEKHQKEKKKTFFCKKLSKREYFSSKLHFLNCII